MTLTVDCFHFQLGVCPVCLENGGEKLPCCQATMHSPCLQDWIWQGCSIECPCCKHTLPCRLVQRRLVELFQRLPDIKAGFIDVSVFVSASDFKPPYPETVNNRSKAHHSTLVSLLIILLTGFKRKSTTTTSSFGKWRSSGHCQSKSGFQRPSTPWRALVGYRFCGIFTPYHDRGRPSHVIL